MGKINIAIDGYSSCGKSTMAKALAAELGYVYIDTGAMYRAITLYAMRNDIVNGEEIDTSKLVAELDNIQVQFQYNNEQKRSETFLNGQNVEKEIREMAVSGYVSKVSLIKEVREKLVDIQRSIGKDKGVVMDGRDIGSVVFPNAELKIFMTADEEVRAQRRFEELKAKGIEVTIEEVIQNIRTRDHQDVSRELNPLKQADDALVLDNTDLTPNQQLQQALEWSNDRINQ